MVLHQKAKEGSWRDCSVVRGLAAFPQTLHAHGGSQLYVTTVLGDSASTGTTCMWCTGIYMQAKPHTHESQTTAKDQHLTEHFQGQFSHYSCKPQALKPSVQQWPVLQPGFTCAQIQGHCIQQEQGVQMSSDKGSTCVAWYSMAPRHSTEKRKE